MTEGAPRGEQKLGLGERLTQASEMWLNNAARSRDRAYFGAGQRGQLLRAVGLALKASGQFGMAMGMDVAESGISGVKKMLSLNVPQNRRK